MTINKFQGKTKEEAIEKAKLEFGPNAVIMNVKEVKPKGFLSVFKSPTYEVTAAIEDKENLANPMSALMPQAKLSNINLSADEKIDIPQPQRTLEREMQAPFSQTMAEMTQRAAEQPVSDERQFKERLDSLSDMLEQKLSAPIQEDSVRKSASTEELNFVRILYTTLIKNEVNEKYVNQILDEVEKFIRPGNNVDLILPNIYQKLILKFGQPKTIELSGKKPNVIFFIGPTGVGKTTTIAKIASKYKVEYNRKVAFITADTYRIAATEQLRVYANILDAPMSIVYTVEEMNEAIEKYMDYDLIFVDTAGFSHKNEQQREDMKKLLQGVNEEYRREVYLVLSATTKYNDLLDIVDIYREISDYKLIFTKLDETSSYGNLLNIKLYADADLSYVTTGQNVPDDIEVFDTQKIVKQLLGGR
ncbi:MAG: flagellar biosynthesis protein FlhF [Agathobacter sp.]|nr:flagellar biosynthesis protein FlhF [Agathobacter sp.]